MSKLLYEDSHDYKGVGLDPNLYEYDLILTNHGKPLIQEHFFNIDQAVRKMNNLASEWNIQTEVVPMYATGERNGIRIELKGKLIVK